MAEAIAIAGVAVQFLDVSARLLSILSRFCQNLEHVPRQVRSTVQELTVFRHLVQVIDLDIRASNTGPVSTLSGALSPDHVILAISVLNQCITQAQELEDILQPLMPKASDHVLKKRWRAVASMRAEKEILDKWTQLQGLKTTLTLWYNHQTLVLLKDQGLAGNRIGSIEQDLSQIQRRFPPLEDQLRELSESSTNSMKSKLDGAHICAGRLDQNIGRMADNLIASKSTINATYDGVESIRQELPSVRTALSRIEDGVSAWDTRGKLQQNPPVTLSQESCESLANQICQRIVSSPRLAADLLGNDSVENISFAEDYTSFPAKPRPTLLLTCTCSVRHSIWELSWPPMFIHYNKRTLHQHGCPRYHYSRVQCTLGARLILPKLLGRSFHAMFSATHGAGGYTLASTLIAVRVVDRTISPAFRTIDIAQQEIVDLGYPDVMDRWGWFTQRRPQYTLSQQERLSKAMVILEKVRNELQSSFCSGKASPSDQDTTGFTLLHDFVFLAMSMFDLQSSLLNQISSIISVLIEAGVDPNASCSPFGVGAKTSNLTALDAIFHILTDSNYGPVPKFRCDFLRLDCVLTKYGCETTGERAIRWPRMVSPYTLDIFIRSPEVAIDCGYSQLCLAVIHRSETELRRLIQSGHDIEGDRERRFSPLSFAIGWTEGIKILLEAGADAFLATSNAMEREDELTLKLTLPKCPTFRQPTVCTSGVDRIAGSLLSYALYMESSRAVIHLIVQRLAEERRQLADLAREALPYDQLRRFGLHRKEDDLIPLQGNVGSIVESLWQKNIEVPATILPYPSGTVYHEQYMTVDAADELWAQGFHMIDEYDAWGCTPLLLACTRLSSWEKMTSWYLDKGAVATDFHHLGITSCLHALAAFYLRWYDIGPFNEPLMRLSLACSPVKPDFCVCYCCSDGCLPVHIFLKRRETNYRIKWNDKARQLSPWFDLSSIGSTEREECYSEVCRLEVFERLGMAHTCCELQLTYRNGPLYGVPSFKQMAEEEQVELRDEDQCSGLVDSLEGYMKLFETLRKEYPGQIAIFWEAWWRTLAELLPEGLWDNDQRVWVPPDMIDQRTAEEDQEKAGDEVSSDSGRGFGPDEDLIRSRMEFFMGGGGLALMENIFCDTEMES